VQSASRRGTRLNKSQRRGEAPRWSLLQIVAFGQAPLARNRYQSFIESSAIRPASLVMLRVGTRHGDSPLIHRFPRFGFALSPKLQEATVSNNHFQVESHAFAEVEQISREGGCVAGKVTVTQKLSTRDKSIACHPVIGHGAIERLCLPVLSRQVFGERLEILRKLECIVHPRARLRWC